MDQVCVRIPGDGDQRFPAIVCEDRTCPRRAFLTNRRLMATMSNRQTIGCKRAGGYPVTLGHRAHAPIWSRYGIRGDHDTRYPESLCFHSCVRGRRFSETAVADLYLIKVETMDPTTTGSSKNKRELFPQAKLQPAIIY